MENISAAIPPLEPPIPSYAEMLKAYLDHRPMQKGEFFISEWLQSLPQNMLDSLGAVAEVAMDNECVHEGLLVDITSVCEIAVVAENRAALVPKNPDGVRKITDKLRVVIALVATSKAGYIELTAPIALSSNKNFKFSVTKAGRKIGIRLAS